MRPLYSFHSSYPHASAARTIIAAGAVAGLIVIAACSDAGSKSITAPPAPRGATIASGGFGQAQLLKLCVDPTSPTGVYTFVNTKLNRNVSLDGLSQALPGNGFFNGVSWFDPGDGGDGTTVANAAQAVNYTITNQGNLATPDCVTVLDRTSGNAAFMAKLPIGSGGTCDPNTTACGGINDSFAAATVTYVSNTVSAVYDHTDCTLDDGVLIPQQANPPATFQTWPIGGLSFNHLSPSTYICDNHNNPIRGFVNFEHGATLSFVFTPAPPTSHNCTFTQGYYKNHDSYTAGILSGNTSTTYINASGELLIGAYALTAAQVDDILSTPVGKGYSAGGVTFTKDQLAMIHQLITAELNIAGGASPATVAATITAANANYTTASKSQLSSWTDTLDSFNNGNLGPSHCS